MSNGTAPGSTPDWIGVAAGHPFGLHTLPFGVFTDAAREQPRVGVAVGDAILDLTATAAALLPEHLALFGSGSLDTLLAAGRRTWTAVRAALTEWLTDEQYADVLAPLLVPEILLGAALYLLYARLAVQASIWTLLFGHLVICTPYVIRSVTAGLVGQDPRLEEAAMSLGATRVQAFVKVTLPLLRSSLLSGAIFAFIISFSDINLALFLSGPESTSLPVHIFSQIQWQGDPTIAAASSLQIVIIGMLILLVQRIFRLRLIV